MRALVLLLLLSGCANLDGTVAAGQVGSVDYCIKILGNEAICINAERKDKTRD